MTWGKEEGKGAEPRGTAHSLVPQSGASVAQGTAQQLSKEISPPFKTCLRSSKEREQFSSCEENILIQQQALYSLQNCS